MINPICIFKTITRSFRCGALVMGHEYQTASFKTPPNVHILVCKECGHQSIGWSFNSLEEFK